MARKKVPLKSKPSKGQDPKKKGLKARTKPPSAIPGPAPTSAPPPPRPPDGPPPEIPPEALAALPPPQPLSPVAERFVREYLLHFKAGRAYRTVCPHVTRESARVLGHRLLMNVNVRREIRAQRRERARSARIEAPRVLREAARILFADLADCYGPDNRLLPVRDIPQPTRSAIQSVKEEDTHTVRGTGKDKQQVSRRTRHYKLFNKGQALGYLFKHLALEQELPAIDVLMAVLPRPVADLIRKAIAQYTGSTDSDPVPVEALSTPTTPEDVK